MSLLPGFRFYPTDIELVMYFLKRKVTGKKIPVEAIAEVNIYKLSPWDLHDKSCLKSKDLEWFFFCPVEKKYASGNRVKRATEYGYWKKTGKDRPVCYDARTIGMVKTLVFHLRHDSKMERTNWVIHEYKIVDEQLAASGVQDLYVLCKVFKKSGLGPKNGAHYGAPFNEADWGDDDSEDAQNLNVSSSSNNFFGTSSTFFEMQSSVKTGTVDFETTSGFPLSKADPSMPAHLFSNDWPWNDSMDEIDLLLASFTDEHMFTINDDGNREVNVTGNLEDTYLDCFDGNDIYQYLRDPDHWNLMHDTKFGPGIQMDDPALNRMVFPQNSSYIELNDLMSPLDYSVGGGLEQFILPCTFGSCIHENMPESSVRCISQFDFCVSPPALPEESNVEREPMVTNSFYKGSKRPLGFNFRNEQEIDKLVIPDMKRQRYDDTASCWHLKF